MSAFGRVTAAHDIIYDRYQPAAFVGRDWLVEKVAAFRDHPGARHLVIVGEPGSGKSAFVAYLAEIWNCPRHFIRTDSTEGVTGVAAKHFLCSIGAQLYQKYGGAIFEQAAVPTQVTVGLTSGKAQVLGQYVNELYALPFLPLPEQDVKVTVGAALGESKVVGLQVNRLLSVAEAMNIEDLLYVAVLNPLEKLLALHPEERVVLLVDALDETVWHPGKSILDVIPKAPDPDFPRNLRIVMTSRPGSHLVRFRTDDQLRLDDEDQGFKQAQAGDAKRYVEKRLKESPLDAATALLSREEGSTLVEEISNHSDGNFLYLHHLFNAMVAAVNSGERNLRQIPIPGGLDEIYRVFALEKIKAAKKIAEWVKIYLPILGILAVAREPLKREQIAGFAKVKKAYVDFVVTELEQFLEVRAGKEEDRHALYHRSFADYLLDPSRNRDYPIQAAEAHGAIARYYRGRSRKWSKVKWKGLEDLYAYHHLTTHLVGAGKSNELVELLDAPWIAAKISHLGSYLTLIPDFALAANAAFERKPPDMAQIAGLSVARQTARELTLNFPEDLLVGWIRSGQSERALNSLESIIGPIRSGRLGGAARPDSRAVNLLVACAEALAHPGSEFRSLDERVTTVYTMFEKALALINAMYGSFRRVESLEHAFKVICECPLLTRDQKMSLLEAAEKQAWRERRPEMSVACLGIEAEALLRCGDADDKPAELLQRAEQLLSSVPPSVDVLAARAYLLPVWQAKNSGVVSYLRSLVEAIEDPFAEPSLTRSALGLMVRKWVGSEQSDAETVSFLRELVAQSVKRDAGAVASEIARAFCRVGHSEEAFEMIDRLGRAGRFPGAEALFGATRELFEADASRTSRWLAEAQQHLELFTSIPRDITFVTEFQYAPSLAVSYAQISRWDLLFETVGRARKHLGALAFSELIRIATTASTGAIENTTRLLAEFDQARPDPGKQDRAAVFAAAGLGLIDATPEQSTDYLKRAERLCLANVERTDVNSLHRLVSIALYEAGDPGAAVDQVLRMEGKPEIVKGLGKLIDGTRPEQKDSLKLLVEHLLYLLKPEGSDDSDHLAEGPFDEARRVAMKIVPKLYEKDPDHAELSAKYLLRTTTMPEDTEDVLRYVMGLAGAYAPLDLETSLSSFDTVITKLHEFAGHGTVFNSSIIGDLFKVLSSSATAAPEPFRPRIEQARDLVRKLSSKEQQMFFAPEAALLIAPYDASAAGRELQTCIEQLRSIPPEPLNRYVVAIAEWFGERSGPQMFEASLAGQLAEQIVLYAGYDLAQAGALLTQLCQSNLLIESRVDRAQALASLINTWTKAPDDLLDMTKGILVDILSHVNKVFLGKGSSGDRENYRLASYVYDCEIRALCEIGLFKFAEDLLRDRTAFDHEGAQKMSIAIGIARRKQEAGRLSAFEQEYLGERDNDAQWANLIVSRNPVERDQWVDRFLRDLVGDQQSRRELIEGRLREMMIQAMSVGGTELVKQIINSIDEYDDRFERAADLVAAGV
jgi:hypothetical protein